MHCQQLRFHCQQRYVQAPTQALFIQEQQERLHWQRTLGMLAQERPHLEMFKDHLA
jgi:hypothetical protein